MTNAELLAKIKAEIERLKSIEYPCDNSQQATGFFNALDRMKDFLDTLPEQPVEGLEEELDRFIASGKSVTVDDYGTYKVSYHDFKKVARHFAEWQKEQMLNEAVEGEVCIPNAWVEPKEGKELVVRAEISKELGFKFGEKVRVIICKKED